MAAAAAVAVAASRVRARAHEAWTEEREAWDLSRSYVPPAGPPGGWPALPPRASQGCHNRTSAMLGTVPLVAVRAYLDAAAEELLPRMRARAVRWKLLSSSACEGGVHTIEVLACFHADGWPRGWCANLHARVDANAPDPADWRFETVGATAAGWVGEDVLVMRHDPWLAGT